MTRRPDDRDEGTRAVALPDGRVLEFADYGDPRGVPVVAHHGSYDAHALWRMVHADCCDAGVRLIVPDRPGYGGSTPQPERRVTDWPTDLLTLVDALGFESVAVLSLREGVAYATAAAALLPDRVDRAALVASRRPGARLRPRLSEADRDLLAPQRVPLPPSPATTLDARLCRRDWGFDLASVTAPTSLWLGLHDDRRAAGTLRRIRGQLPHASVVIDPARGSYSLLTRAAEILEYLRKTAD
jgi:pimeloyl-ACP methyl ester carboxylesterase